ncbi:bifunctional 2-polyprenyl-6-hydroxyphenol methylase/3-demethylubiquinol 3-O-methyltransferase UbiG [Piscirickettsia litoralis]
MARKNQQGVIIKCILQILHTQLTSALLNWKKFAELAHEWWDETGRCRALHDLNPARLSFIKHRVSLENKEVLDLGCGGGILSESLAKEGAHITAIDMSKDVLNAAKLHKLESKLEINYQHITAEKLAEESPGKFDVITCMEMLEHVPNPISIFTCLQNFIKTRWASFCLNHESHF